MTTAVLTKSQVQLLLDCLCPAEAHYLGLIDCPDQQEVTGAVSGKPITITLLSGKQIIELRFEIALISNAHSHGDFMYQFYGYSWGDLAPHRHPTSLTFDPEGKLVMIRLFRCGTNLLEFLTSS